MKIYCSGVECEVSFMLQPCGPGAAPVTRANVQTAEEYVAEVWAASVVDLLNIIF